MVFEVPYIVPASFALSVFCALLAMRLKATVTVFELYEKKEKLTDTLTHFYKQLFSIRYLKPLLGTEDIENLLVSAGHPFNLTSEKFDIIRLTALIVSILCGLYAVVSSSIPAMFGLLVFKLPEIWLVSAASKRRRQMKREFFLVASRLSAAYSAGLDTYSALKWASSIQGAKKSVLRAELARALEKIKMDTPLENVLEEFAERTGLLEAKRLATVITQAQKYGSSVSEKLAEAIKDTRERRKAAIIGQAQTAEQKMQMAVIIMALPTIICTLVPMYMSLAAKGGGIF